MNEYRTPEEDREQAEQEAHIRPILVQAVKDCAFLRAAMKFGLPQDVVEPLVDRVWDGLRDGLDGEDRLAAILLLLGGPVDAEADAILHGLRDGEPDV